MAERSFRAFDQIVPDKVAADRLEEAMVETFGLEIMKHETTEGVTGRSRFVFARFQMEGS